MPPFTVKFRDLDARLVRKLVCILAPSTQFHVGFDCLDPDATVHSRIS